MRRASAATSGSDLSDSCDEGSILDCEALDERVKLMGSGRHLPVPVLRGGAMVGVNRHSSAAVLSGAAGESREALDSRRHYRDKHQLFDVHQQRLLPMPPSQRTERGDDFMGTGRDLGFMDSFDGFPLYVDDDGVMKVSGNRRRDPFAFGYDAVEEGDLATDNVRGGSATRRNSHYIGTGAALCSSFGTSEGAFVSGSSSYSSSLYEEHYDFSHQQCDRTYAYGHRCSADTSAAAGYGYTPFEMPYASGAGAFALYDGDGAPLPIDAPLPSHPYIASRRRRLVGAASSAQARLNAQRRRSSNRKGNRTRARGARGRRLGRRNTTAAASSHSPPSRHGSYRGVPSSSRLPIHLPGSNPLLLGMTPLPNTGRMGIAATASGTGAPGIHGSLSSLVSAAASANAAPSEVERVTRMREYLLAREEAVKKRYATDRRGCARGANTGTTAGSNRGTWKTTTADTLRLADPLSTGDSVGKASIKDDALASQHTHGVGFFSPLQMSLGGWNQSLIANTGKAGTGPAAALATVRSARLRSKDASTQLQAVTTTEESVYVRADPASAAATGARGRDHRGVSLGDAAPAAMHGTALPAGMDAYFGQRMMTLRDPYTGLAIAPACTPLPTKTETAAAAVHMCAAGIQFFRDPTAPRPSAAGFLPSTALGLPATISPLWPTPYLLNAGHPPWPAFRAGTETVSGEDSLRASVSAPYTLTTPHRASSASAAYRLPTSLQPLATSLTSKATQTQAWQLSSRESLVKEASIMRSPRSLVMARNPSATSMLPKKLSSHDSVAPVDKAATEASDWAQRRWRPPSKTDAFYDRRPRLTVRDESATAGAPLTVASSGAGDTALLGVIGLRGSEEFTATPPSFGDCARSWWRVQSRGATASGSSSSNSAEPAAAAGIEGGEDCFPLRWHCSVPAFGMSGREPQDGAPITAGWSDEAARGWCGVCPIAVHPQGGAGEYDISFPTAGASSSASAAMPTLFAYPPSITPYVLPCHPQQNTRHHAWTAEGVSATSNTSCVVHVFTVSREMLRSVYDYVAYMCVAKRHADLQRWRRKREGHLSTELAAGRPPRDAQWCLRCPHCGVVGKVVRSAAARGDSEAMSSNPRLSSTRAQSEHLHDGRKHHHHRHSLHHSRASHHTALGSAATTPEPLLFPNHSEPTASASLGLSLAQQQQQHTKRFEWSPVKSPSPRPSSLPPQPPRRSDFGMDSATQGGSRAVVRNTNFSMDGLQGEHRNVLVDEVGAVLTTPLESEVPQSSPAAPALRTACAPLTRGSSGRSGSSPALPRSAHSASPPLVRLRPQTQLHEENCSSQESSHIRSMLTLPLPTVETAPVSPSPSPSPPQPLTASALDAAVSAVPAKLHNFSCSSSTKGEAPSGIFNSSDARVEVPLDSFDVSAELSPSLYTNSKLYEQSAQAAYHRYSSASGNDLRAPRQQPLATVLARGVDEECPLDELATSLSPRKPAEELDGATGKNAAMQRSSSRGAFVNSNSDNHSHRQHGGGAASDAEDVQPGLAGSAAPHVSRSTASHSFTIPTSTSPNCPVRMADTGKCSTTMTRHTATTLSAAVTSADSSASKHAPPTSISVATRTVSSVMTSLNAKVRPIGSSLGSNPNSKTMSGTDSLLCPMVGSTMTPAVRTLAPSTAPVQSQGGEYDEGYSAVAQRWGDTDVHETAREHGLSRGASYVCLGCHRDVVPKKSLLTPIGDNISVYCHSQHTHHHSAAQHSHHTNNNTGSGVCDTDADDVEVEGTVSASIGVMAFEDLLQDDVFIYALHTALCESLMMPSTQEPPPLPPPLPAAPRKRSRKRTSRTPPARADVNGFLQPILTSAPVHQTAAPPQLWEDTSVAATDAEGEVCTATALGVPHQQSPEPIGNGGAVSSKSIGGYIGDQTEPLTQGQSGRQQQQQQQQRETPTSALSMSAAPSASSTSSLLTSLEGSVATDREGSGCPAAPSPIRLSLACCGLTVNVLPYLKPPVPSAEVQGRVSDGDIKRREPARKHLTRIRTTVRKTSGVSRVPRQRFGSPALLSRLVIPRMREDASTRGLTPSTMLISDAAVSQYRHKRRCSKQRQGACIHHDTPLRQRRRSSLSTAASKLISVENPSNGSAVHPAAASKPLIVKGTFSSEKHRIQVNPRTPLDAVSKDRIMERIFRQDRLGSRSDISVTAVARSCETEKRRGRGSDSAASVGPVLTAVPASGAGRRRRGTRVNRRDDARPAAGRSVNARGFDVHKQRHPHHHPRSYTQELAQKHAALLLPPGRVPKPLGLDLGVYHDSSLVLEIDIAYPRLPRGNVRELLAEWKDTCQPHPVLVEAVIRNIVYAVLVQLSTLHTAGRTHGSVKSTNVFPLWHAMEGTRESGLMMPPRPRQCSASPSPLAVAHEKCEAESMQDYGRKSEAVIRNEEEAERRQNAPDADAEGACESGDAPNAVSPATGQAALAPQRCNSDTSTSLTNSRLLSYRQRREASHTALAHLRRHQKTCPHVRGTQCKRKPARGFGAGRTALSRPTSSAPAALPGASSSAISNTPSTGLVTAMAVYRRSSLSASTGGSARTDSKQADPSTARHPPVGQSLQSSMLLSSSAVLSSESMLPSKWLSTCSRHAPSLTTDATQPYHADNSSRSTTTLSPTVGMLSSNTRVRRGGGGATRLRRGSMGINVGGKCNASDPNDDADDEGDNALVPLVAEVLTPSSAAVHAFATGKAAAATEVGTAEPNIQPHNNLLGTPSVSGMPSCPSFAAVPRHRDYRCSHPRSRRGRRSWSSAIDDPDEWLASSVPRRYVRGVELRPAATVWFPQMTLNKADAAAGLVRTPDVEAQPVLTRGPVGAVPNPQFGSVCRDETSPLASPTAHRDRWGSDSAGSSTSPSAALHGANSSTGQDAPDPLQWSRQVLLVENVGAVVAAALRTAMTCVLMRHPPRSHPSPLASPLAHATSTKTPPSTLQNARHTADVPADLTTAAAEKLRLCSSTQSKSADASVSHRRKKGAASAPTLRVYAPDVTRGLPPSSPNLFAVQESEYVPAPELIRLPADDACTLRRPWLLHTGGAAAADKVEGDVTWDHPRLPHSPCAAAVDTGAESAAQWRETLTGPEVAASPETRLRNTFDPYPTPSAAVDIWELGMMALELADGPPPTTWLTQREPTPALRTYPWSSYFHAFVSLCLKRTPEQRGTAAELLQHPWFSVALVPQASMASPPTAIQSSGSNWGRGTAGGGSAGASVDPKSLSASFQCGKEGAPALVSLSTRPSLSSCRPGVMGIGCLTEEEKAEWENYDYTLLYASSAHSARLLTTNAAAASAAAATVAGNHRPTGNSRVRLEGSSTHQKQGAATSASVISAGERNTREASVVDAISVGERPSVLGQSHRGTDPLSLSHAAAAADAIVPQSSLLTVSSPGVSAAVESPLAAVAATAATASANDELMMSMCAVDLAQTFAELIAKRWAQQQKLVPSPATAAGAYDAAANGRKVVSPPQRNFFTATTAATSLDGANPFLLSVVSPQSNASGSAAAAAAYNAALPQSAQWTMGQCALSQQQSELLCSKMSADEMMMPIWGGHSTMFNNASLSGQVTAVPAISPSGALSPLPLSPLELVGRGPVHLLPAHLPTLYAPLCDPRRDSVLMAANARALPWTARMMGERDGMAGIQEQPQPHQAQASAACGAASPWFQLRARAEAERSTPFTRATFQALPHRDGSVSQGGSGCPAFRWDYGNLNDYVSTSTESSSNARYHGFHARTVSGSSSESSNFSSTQSDTDSHRTASGRSGATHGGTHVHISGIRLSSASMLKVGDEVPVSTRTLTHHLDDVFKASSPLTDDATSHSVAFKVGTQGQCAGGSRGIVVYDPATGGDGLAMKEGASSCAAASKLREPLSDEHCPRHGRHDGSAGRDDDGGVAPRPSTPSSSRPKHHLVGTVVSALARLSVMAYRPSDTDRSWSEASSSSSDSENSTSCNRKSDSATLSPTSEPSRCCPTTLELDDKAACMQGFMDSGDDTGSEGPDEDVNGLSESPEVQCDELLRCLLALQRNCPAAVSLWCARVVQQAMRHPRTATRASRVLEQIESLLPAGRARNLDWLKRPDDSPLPHSSPDPLGAGDSKRHERGVGTTGDVSSSLSAAAAARVSSHSSASALPPAELDASPSSFQNYEMAKWIYALHQALPRCT
ncbi:hypothetical protein, conserved [Leishmania tarentolae]|uniref:Protein kinase domain-containing protein n=1 Tax=Leishmania tarentolae TaxID=5689 RepID=A0A640KKJ9_LEITA|nr:hypothetical protein, conserved [Leishmania tarentolae]